MSEKRIILYHLTWDSNVAGVLKLGLLPNHVPNRWVIADANERSGGKTYLCTQARRAYWEMTYGDGWVTPPSPDAELVWLRVDCTDIPLTPDAGVDSEGEPEDYEGDFWTRRKIPASRIAVVGNRVTGCAPPR
jgi:hypothetical protein